MYVVSIRYPRQSGQEFNLEHWRAVHMPKGIGTYHRTNGFMPKRVMIQHSVFGMSGEPESTDSYATVWLLFDRREGLEGFMRLHNDKVKSADLERDFDNYAPAAPHIALGELEEFNDLDDILRRGQALLAAEN